MITRGTPKKLTIQDLRKVAMARILKWNQQFESNMESSAGGVFLARKQEAKYFLNYIEQVIKDTN